MSLMSCWAAPLASPTVPTLALSIDCDFQSLGFLLRHAAQIGRPRYSWQSLPCEPDPSLQGPEFRNVLLRVSAVSIVAIAVAAWRATARRTPVHAAPTLRR